jgi:integrase
MKDNQEDDSTDSTLSPEVKNRLQNLLEEDFVSEENGEQVKEFIHELNSVRDDQISDFRLLKYLSQFGQILPHVDFSLKEATLDQVNDLAVAIDSQDVAATTKRDRRVCLNKFYRTMFKVRNRPTRVWDILESEVTDTSHPGRKEKKRHYDFIYPDEVMEMSNAARNKRDALLPLLFYCTGARLDAIRTLQVKDIERKETHFTITLNSQKNDNLRPTRDNHLTRCTHLLREWLEHHPCSDDPEAYLFCSTQGSYNHQGEQVKDRGDIVTRKTISKALDRLADRVDLDKRHNPHAFRFSMVTFYRKVVDGWDIGMVADRGGWKNLQQVREYTLELDKIKGRDRLVAQGVEPEDGEDLEALDKRTCSNCQTVQPPTKDLCDCGHALTDKVARQQSEQEIVMIERNQKGLPGESSKI